MRLRPLGLLLGLALLAACTSVPSPDERRQQATQLAQEQHWQALELEAGICTVVEIGRASCRERVYVLV